MVKYLLLLVLVSFPLALTAQGTTLPPKIDTGTLLWIQTMRAHPELNPSGTHSLNAVQERYNRMVAEATGTVNQAKSTAASSINDLGANLDAIPLEKPVVDSLVTPASKFSSQPPDITPKHLTVPAGARLTPYQLCLKDGGCDGLK